MSACDSGNSSGAPDARGGSNQLSLAGSYDTRVTLLAGSTCSGPTPASATRISGPNPKTVLVSPARYLISLAGRFTLPVLEATVSVEQTDPNACTYAVQWVGTTSGAPNVIPG